MVSKKKNAKNEESYDCQIFIPIYSQCYTLSLHLEFTRYYSLSATLLSVVVGYFFFVCLFACLFLFYSLLVNPKIFVSVIPFTVCCVYRMILVFCLH